MPAFVAPVQYTVGNATIDVKTGDFNKDGRLDLVTANRVDATVSVLLGNADGTFQAARTFAAGNTPLSLAVGDFNQDGKLDLVMGTDNYLLSILFGQGDGTFAPPVLSELGVPYGPSVVTSVTTGDLNADGKMDVVASWRDIYGYLGTYVNVLLGHGDGSFTGVSTSSTGIYGNGSTELVLADFDGDGDDDLVADGSMIFLSNGDGTLQEPRSIGSGGLMTVADFDADGHLDLATTTWNSTVRVQRGNGDGTFQPAQSFATGGHFHSVNAADVSGDGVLDLVGVVGINLTVLLGNGDGSFGVPIQAAAGFSPDSLVLADFNADGRPDAAGTAYWSNIIAVRFNDGNWDSLPPPPTISISDVTRAEGRRNRTTTFTFTVTLSAPSVQPVTMSYQTVNGTATTGNNDYVARTGTLTFNPGETTKTITISVKGDRKREADEYFYLDLFGLSDNAVFTKNRGLGTILNDD